MSNNTVPYHSEEYEHTVKGDAAFPKSQINTALRTEKCWNRYQTEPRADVCFMCEPPEVIRAREFKHWRIICNQFPYDNVADMHHLLLPRVHGWKWRLNISAWIELYSILKVLDREGKYDCIMRNFVAAQSQPQHFHYHLLTWKRYEQGT